MALFEALQAKGWHLEDDRIYPPNGTFSIEGDVKDSKHTLEKMYSRCSKQLEQMPQSEHFFHDKEQFNKGTEDVTSLIIMLKELLGKQP